MDPAADPSMEPTLDSLLSFYAERIGGPFPLSLLPADRPLHWQGQTLFGTARGTEPLYLLQSTIDAFLGAAPFGTLSVGFWGHGLNSHAFYYQRREPWGSLFLRLAYGGFDDDNERDALFRIVLTGGQVIEGDGPLFEPGRGPAEALGPLLEGA